MPEPSPFGRMVKERRRSRDLTQERLAELVGCAVVTLKRIEYGTLRPSRQVAERLAEALAVPAPERAAFVDAARAARTPSAPPLVPSAAPHDYSGHTLRGYELRERIGGGGFGVVYRAYQPAVGRDVAVKVILPHLAGQPDFIRRFEAEAQLVARLEHPQIVPLYDYWRDQGGAFLVMRLMRGGSLHALLGQRWELAAALRLADEVAAALHAAHRRGVVHRDVKPANILLDEERRAYLADFGIAKDVSAAGDATTAGALVGSPDYVSPEQLRGDTPSPASDLYSLALVLYELLAGARPYAELTPAARAAQRLSLPLPPLRPLRPDLPAALDEVLARASAPDVADRYADAPSLVADLARATQRWAPGAPFGGPAAHVGRPADAPTLTGATARTPENPYRGLRAFHTADAPRFFGREALTQRLLARLAEARGPARFLAVVGPSGSGKSSAVRAGLVPAILCGGLPGSEHWFVAQATPGARPLEEIEAALLRVAVNPPPSLLDQLRAEERGLARAVRRCLPDDERVELLLLIDQFEELWTLVHDEAERSHVLRSLAAAVADPRARLRVVITLRADFFDRPLAQPGFAELVRRRTEVVTPLNESELEQAITMPAAGAGVGVERELVRRIVRDVAARPGALPQLQYALTELFERAVLLAGGAPPTMLRLAAYDAVGGISGALARRAEEVYAALDDAGRELARQALLRLVQPGEAGDDTRRRVRVAELPTATNGVLARFDQARLLTFDRNPHTGEPTVEVAHEALIAGWERLRGWLDECRAALRVHRRLAAAAGEWQDAGRDASFLASGARLAQFEELRGDVLALTDGERDFLAASVTKREHREAEERRRQAELRESLARTEAQRLAAEANRLLQSKGNAELAALLALRSMRLRPTPEGDEALAGAALLDFPARLLEGGGSSVAFSPDGASVLFTPSDEAVLIDLATGAELRRFTGHASDIAHACFTPDGARVLTASYDGTARVWETRTGTALHTLVGHTSSVGRLAVSPDGRHALTGSYDGTARVWDIASGAELRVIACSTVGISAAAYAPDGRTFASGGRDEYVRLWDAGTGRELLALPGASGGVLCIAFTPDGCGLLVGDARGGVQLWDAGTGRELCRMVGHVAEVMCALFTCDGARCVTSGNDGTVRVWDTTTGAELRRLVGHNAFVFGVALAPDDRTLVSVSGESGMRLWDLRAPPYLPQIAGALGVFIGHGRVATFCTDRVLRLWDARTGQVIRAFDEPAPLPEALAVSPDGRWVLSGHGDNLARLWDVEAGRLARTLVGHTAGVRAAAFSPDGRHILTGSYDWTARLWDLHTGAQLHLFDVHRQNIFGVAFSPDGRRMLTASVDGTTRLWDVAAGAELLMIPEGSACVAFTPDGAHALTGDWNGMARLWDLTSGAELRRFAGHISTVWNLRCSPDGRRLLTASGDGTARLWDVTTGAELRRFAGNSGSMFTVDLSPDGRHALTCCDDGTARLWDIDAGATMAYLEGRLLRGFTERERMQYGLGSD